MEFLPDAKNLAFTLSHLELTSPIYSRFSGPSKLHHIYKIFHSRASLQSSFHKMRVLELFLITFTLSGLCVGRAVNVQSRLTRRNESADMAMLAMAKDDYTHARNLESNAHIAQSSAKEVEEVKEEKTTSSTRWLFCIIFLQICTLVRYGYSTNKVSQQFYSHLSSWWSREDTKVRRIWEECIPQRRSWSNRWFLLSMFESHLNHWWTVSLSLSRLIPISLAKINMHHNLLMTTNYLCR